MNIGEKIKLHRKSLGLTQTELGIKLGVKKNAVSKWECGRVDDIPTSKIKAMAALFDVAPSYLIDEEEQLAPVSRGVHHVNYVASTDSLTNQELQLLSLCRSMNAEGQEKLIDYADDLASSGKYKKSTSAGMVQNG